MSESKTWDARAEAGRGALLAQPAQTADHVADVSKLVSEFVIADLAMTHLGSYAEKDYDFAMAVMKAYQRAVGHHPKLSAGAACSPIGGDSATSLASITPQPAEGET